MITLTLSKDVVYSDNSSIPVVVEPCLVGCVVRYLIQEYRVVWDDVTDMEKLSKIFEDMPVRVFVIVVELLGVAYRNKELYTE